MTRRHDLELVLQSKTPIVIIETEDEPRVLDMLTSLNLSASTAEYLPLFRWTITDGLQRLDIDLEPQSMNSEPTDVLKHIRAVKKPGVYVLLDFHPFVEDPVHIRLLKDICLQAATLRRQLVMVSHKLDLPDELDAYSARVELALPEEHERCNIIDKLAREWSAENSGADLKTDKRARQLLVENLAGLSFKDTERLARNAIFDDGALSRSDLPSVMKAKYELLNRGGTLQFEYDTARFSDVGGLSKLKDWLAHRKPVFQQQTSAQHLDPPKGLLLIGVQGCGKSLAAKATAGIFGVPLLRLDFATLYDKYHGETERKLRESLATAEVMAPCVLWIDEIEKGIAGRGGETGTTQRVLSSFLTWLAERNSRVFVVATANDISALPPELVRKGRFDEIFFVDLPKPRVRASILAIHLVNRGQQLSSFDLESLADATDGFSGAEIEQAVVSALYAAHAKDTALTTELVMDAITATQPLSVVMAERIAGLRAWAEGRTVLSD